MTELAHSTLGVVEATTYLLVSLKNGAPGSSSAVRVDQAGANISNVVRPSRIALAEPERPPRVLEHAVEGYELVDRDGAQRPAPSLDAVARLQRRAMRGEWSMPVKEAEAANG